MSQPQITGLETEWNAKLIQEGGGEHKSEESDKYKLSQTKYCRTRIVSRFTKHHSLSLLERKIYSVRNSRLE